MHSASKRVDPPLAERIGELAGRQHGCVALYQLKQFGVSAKTAQSRARRGHWRRLHRGVYFAGRGPITIRTRWMAAVLAYGPQGLLSHRDAAALHNLRRTNRARIEVSLPRKSVRHRRGLELHAAAGLTDDDITVIDGIPCTALARTLIDLAEVIDRRGVVLAIEQAERLRTLNLATLEAALDRARGRRGAAVVRSVLDEYHGPSDRGAFAAAFRRVYKRAGLDDPEPEALIELEDGPIHVDFLWRAERLAVELDSRRFHDTARGFDTDRDRDQQLLLAGFTPVRLTWRHLHAEAPRTERRLRRLHEMGRAAAGERTGARLG